MCRVGWRLGDRNDLAVYDLGHHELFNLNDDPLEIHNLYGTPETDVIVKDLKDRIRAWGVRTNDPTAAGL